MQERDDDAVCNLTQGVKAGGCAAKISASQLSAIVRTLPQFTSPQLLTSIDTFEDAAVYKLSEDQALIQTIDFFPPVVDDPYLFGCIAAANALSDIYAMGGTPALALNILCFPSCDYPLSVAARILEGGAHTLQEAGALLVGGHTIQSTDLIYGMSVSGFVHPNRILINGGAKAGDSILLCKALGTGVGLLGLKGECLSAAAQEDLIRSLKQLNKEAGKIAIAHDTHACTDVTGFGLIGHVHEMAKASGLRAVLQSGALPLLPSVQQLALEGFVPAGAYANRNSYIESVSFADDVDVALTDLMFDPQTSGGLLLALPASEVKSVLDAMAQAGYKAARIGEFSAGVPEGFVEVKQN